MACALRRYGVTDSGNIYKLVGKLMFYLILVAVVVIVPLAAYTIYLLRKVRQMEQEKAQAIEIKQQQDQQRVDYITESLQAISLSVIEENLNLSEATIRCKHLLDGLFLPQEHRQRYALLDEVFEQIQGFATHNERRDLPRDERRRQDQARELIEQQYQDKLIALFTDLRGFQMPLTR
jgi:Ca2+/Na+ antiporter